MGVVSLKGCASVLNTYSSKEMRLGSLNIKKRYFKVSAKK
jgi:hypothetical protein